MSLFAHTQSQLSLEWDALLPQLQQVAGFVETTSLETATASVEMLSLEKAVADALQLPLSGDDSPLTVFPPEVLFDIAASYALEPLYVETVGSVEDIWSSIRLVTLPRFRVREVDPEVHNETLRNLVWNLDLGTEALDSIERIVLAAHVRIEKRKQLLDWIRDFVGSGDPVRPINRAKLTELFGRFFPGHPLDSAEIHAVLTRTGVYWCLPSESDFPAESPKAIFLNSLSRLSFSAPKHFPACNPAVSRRADAAFVDEVAELLECTTEDAIGWLDTTVAIEPTTDLEKYLLRDTWGQLWQDELANLGGHSSRIESLLSPLEACECLDLDGRTVPLWGIFHLTAEGKLERNEEVETVYLERWLGARLEALFAPIVSELCADLIEFKFLTNHPHAVELLPQSSRFGLRAAKPDFALDTLRKFTASFGQALRTFVADDTLRRTLRERLAVVLRLKYPRAAAQIDEAIEREVEGMLERLLALHDVHFSTQLPTEEFGGGFATMTVELLRIQSTLNAVISSQKGDTGHDKFPYVNVFLIFLVRWFQVHPEERFWQLSQAIASGGVPLMRTIAAAEVAAGE